MLLCQPFDSEGKKKKITSQTTPKLSCRSRSPAWAELATPPHSVPSRVPSTPARPSAGMQSGRSSRERPIARRPTSRDVRGRGRGWPPGGFPAPADGQRFLFACGSSLRRPGPDCPWGLVHACVAEISFNSSPIYLDLKRLAVIFWRVKGSNLNLILLLYNQKRS